MQFIIRDDDTCYFTSPEELALRYEPLWDACVPVSLAVVPFHAGVRSGTVVPRELWGNGLRYPLEDNVALTTYLKEKADQRVTEILLHGYAHENYPEGPEYVAGEDLEVKTREGRGYLENVLQTKITTFVPPHNRLSRRGWLAMVKAGLNLLGFHPVRPGSRLLTVQALKCLIQRRLFYARPSSTGRLYPYVLDFGTHREFSCVPLVPGTSLKNLRSHLDFAYTCGGDFCVSTHYWELNGDLLGILYELIDYAHGLTGLRFCTASQLFYG